MFEVGLPTLGLGIPGRPPPSRPFPSLPSPPSFPFPVGPTPKPAMGSRERCRLPQWGLAQSHSRQTIWCIYLLPKGAAPVATVFVHFHNNKFKFLYKTQDCLAVAIVWVWGRSTQWGPGVKPLVRGLGGGTKSTWSWSCWWHFAI